MSLAAAEEPDILANIIGAGLANRGIRDVGLVRCLW